MKYLASALLCATLAQTALPCSISTMLVHEDDPGIKCKAYAGQSVHAFTRKLAEQGKHAEYVSFLRELDVGAYVIVDSCGQGKCVDIFVDKEAKGVLKEHYRIPISDDFFEGVGMKFEQWKVERHVKKAYETGKEMAIQVLENDLARYRMPMDMTLPQQEYAAHVESMRQMHCGQATVALK